MGSAMRPDRRSRGGVMVIQAPLLLCPVERLRRAPPDYRIGRNSPGSIVAAIHLQHSGGVAGGRRRCWAEQRCCPLYVDDDPDREKSARAPPSSHPILTTVVPFRTGAFPVELGSYCCCCCCIISMQGGCCLQKTIAESRGK